MATEILMPALSPTMEEGTLAKWLVAGAPPCRRRVGNCPNPDRRARFCFSPGPPYRFGKGT